MATAQTMKPLDLFEPLQNVVPNGKLADTVESGAFNPEIHLCYKSPERIYSMSDLKFPKDIGVSPVAVTEPFALFTENAINRMRAEIFDPNVMSNYMHSSNLTKCQLRGYASEAAPFIFETWNHPAVLAIVSGIAGIELVPQMDLEIAHINLATKTEDQKLEELKALRDRSSNEAEGNAAGCPKEEERPLVDWHTDSYPFVCVTMLSDCTSMIGGETALRTGDGNILKVRGPQMGYAVVMQGRYIEHQALQTFGTTERITSVTSFRPKSYNVKDDTVLTTVRPISDLAQLYSQFAKYRLQILEDRVRERLERLKESMKTGQKLDTKALKLFLGEQEAFLAKTNCEILEDDLVSKGCIDDSHLTSDFTRCELRKRNQ